MAAELWNLLGKVANLAQLSGLHAVMLVAVGMRLLRIRQSRRECAKLEHCLRMLRALLRTTGCDAVLQRSGMGDCVRKALDDAAGLVDWYRRSTLWRRVRSIRAMAAKLREARSSVSCYSVLVLVINGNLLTNSDTTSTPPACRTPQVNDQSHVMQEIQIPIAAETCTSADGETPVNEVKQGVTDGDGRTGNAADSRCEDVPDAIVISQV